jgi:hypothetical protein
MDGRQGRTVGRANGGEGRMNGRNLIEGRVGRKPQTTGRSGRTADIDRFLESRARRKLETNGR